MHESTCSTFHGVAKRSMSAPPVCYCPSDLPAVRSCHAAALAAVRPQRYAQTGGVEVVRRLFLDNETFRGRVRPELMRAQVDAVRPVSRGRAPSVHRSAAVARVQRLNAQCPMQCCVLRSRHERRALKRLCMAWPVAMAATRGRCASGGRGRGRGRGGQQRAGCAAGAQPAARRAQSGPVRRARQAQQCRVAALFKGSHVRPPLCRLATLLTHWCKTAPKP